MSTGIHTALLVAAIALSGCSKSDGDKAKKQADPTETTPAGKPDPNAPDQARAPSDKPPGLARPAKCGNGKAPVTLQVDKAVHDDGEDAPTCVLWTVAGQSVVVEPSGVSQDEGAGEGNLVARIGAADHKVARFGYNLATGTSYRWQVDKAGHLVFVAEEGGSGADPGTAYAVQLRWDEGKGSVTVANSWEGEATEDLPAWAAEPADGSKQKGDAKDPCSKEENDCFEKCYEENGASKCADDCYGEACAEKFRKDLEDK